MHIFFDILLVKIIAQLILCLLFNVSQLQNKSFFVSKEIIGLSKLYCMGPIQILHTEYVCHTSFCACDVMCPALTRPTQS